MRVNLSGIPETMLWTLHNRASEAAHPDGVIRDEKCLEIYAAVDYDYARSFGQAEASHGIRSALFDKEIRRFIAKNPNGIVINLGEGLETQRYRITDDAGILWVCVDVPDAIAIRERFIEPDARHVHIAKSALDLTWLDEIPEGRPVYITAQGLLMYFKEADVKNLLQAIANSFPKAELAFDHIPVWLSQKTLSEEGWNTTADYRTPPMPWGVSSAEIQSTLKDWLPTISEMRALPFRFPRGWRRYVFNTLAAIPGSDRITPGVTYFRLGS